MIIIGIGEKERCRKERKRWLKCKININYTLAFNLNFHARRLLVQWVIRP